MVEKLVEGQKLFWTGFLADWHIKSTVVHKAEVLGCNLKLTCLFRSKEKIYKKSENVSIEYIRDIS